jgi:prevent-host-death family protein
MVARKRQAAVGVRELRQNLSVYLDRVKDGESLQVTEFGRVVALLIPLPAKAVAVRADGARRTRDPPKGSLKDRRPPSPAAGHPSARKSSRGSEGRSFDRAYLDSSAILKLEGESWR